MLFTSKVSAAYGKLTHSQKVVANYVDENYEDIAFSTLEELAEKIGVSTTTVIRFARALDYSGFSEMQDSIKRRSRPKALCRTGSSARPLHPEMTCSRRLSRPI